MRNFQSFADQFKESLDYDELPMIALNCIGNLLNMNIIAGIYFPKASDSEWSLQKAMTYRTMNDIEFYTTHKPMEILDGLAGYVAGYPSVDSKIIHKYTNFHLIEEESGIDIKDFKELEEYNILAYASMFDDEVLSVLIILYLKNISFQNEKDISMVMDLLAKQLGKTAKVHNRLEELDKKYLPWDEDSYS